jgi:glutaconate CoA-transferase subunit B
MPSDEHDDLFVTTLARQMADGERVFAGANQPDVMTAACLARALWAPRLKFWAAGTAHVNRDLDHLIVGRDTYDTTLVRLRGSSFRQAHAFDDGLRAPIVFAGGLQVDGRGNANLEGVRDDEGWKLRGPGSAGLPSLTAFGSRFFIQVPTHDRRSLVDVCSSVSVVGDPVARRSLGLPADALVSVITPLATFVPSTEGLRLTELAPGVSLDEVADRTGFALGSHLEVTERPPVTPAEAAVLGTLRAAIAKNRE